MEPKAADQLGTRGLESQGFEAVEVRAEAGFCVEFGSMIQNSNRPAVAAVANDLQHPSLMLSRAQGHNLGVRPIVHSIHVETKQIGDHRFERPFELRDVCMSVVKVVDNTDVFRVMVLPQVPADGDEVAGLASPPAMVVKAQLTVQFRGFFDQRHEFVGGSCHPAPVVILRWGWDLFSKVADGSRVFE